ncbi:hypothetical protein [Streptomyces sp. NPDC060205]|uniref:hypothetical protein n=1 Tax=Streptomyces sp. NPDC060205 TaxID=3347072 RepID=UPI00365532A5
MIHERVETLSNFRPLSGPTLICNPHLARVAALGIVLEETSWTHCAKRAVDNALSVADALLDEGIPLRGTAARKFTELTYCHQILIDVPLDEARRLRDHFGRHCIDMDCFLRLGVSEITRLGFTVEERAELGRHIAALIKNENDVASEVDRRIGELVESRRGVVL